MLLAACDILFCVAVYVLLRAVVRHLRSTLSSTVCSSPLAPRREAARPPTRTTTQQLPLPLANSSNGGNIYRPRYFAHTREYADGAGVGDSDRERHRSREIRPIHPRAGRGKERTDRETDTHRHGRTPTMLSANPHHTHAHPTHSQHHHHPQQQQQQHNGMTGHGAGTGAGTGTGGLHPHAAGPPGASSTAATGAGAGAGAASTTHASHPISAGSARLGDLLEFVKQEFDGISGTAEAMRRENMDYAGHGELSHGMSTRARR